MLVISLLGGFAFFLIITVAIYIARRRSQKIIYTRQSLGLQWLKDLREFLAKIQKHRGLSAGFLNGEQSLMNEIQILQRSIAQDVVKIEAKGQWMKGSERWRNITDHWGRLSIKFSSYEPSHNLSQHHQMIQNTLYLIEDMADEHSLIRLQGEGKKNVEFLWRDLLQTIEYMGQARAIGTGVAAAGICGSVDRIKLNYLHKKIENGAALISEELLHDADVNAHVFVLLDYIDTKILSAKCDVSPSDYFSTATKSLDYLYEQYDLTLRNLSRH